MKETREGHSSKTGIKWRAVLQVDRFQLSFTSFSGILKRCFVLVKSSERAFLRNSADFIHPAEVSHFGTMKRLSDNDSISEGSFFFSNGRNHICPRQNGVICCFFLTKNLPCSYENRCPERTECHSGLTYLLTACNKYIFEKLIIAQIDKQPAMFITIPTSDDHQTLCWARRITFACFLPNSLKFIWK
jgi:hypothetical protein